MATSIIYPNLTGAQSNFNIPFPYLAEGHVIVALNGVETIAFTFASEFIITMDTAPVGELRIFRRTPADASLVTWTDGSILVDDDLNLGNLQTLYVTEELEDGAFPKTSGGNWDADNLRIENVQDPQSAQDAATKGWVEATFTPVLNNIVASFKATMNNLVATTLGYRNEAETFKNQAQSANSNAQGHSSNSASSATASANSATASAGSAIASEASNVSASGWAADALGWRNEAEDFRDEAEVFKYLAEIASSGGLPNRLQGQNAVILTDANDAVEAGWYRMNSGTANTPYGSFSGIQVCVYNSQYLYQMTIDGVDQTMYWRTRRAGIWSDWSSLKSGTHRGDAANDALNDGKYLLKTGGNLTNTLSIRSDASVGYINLGSGTATRTGYINFYDETATRSGYMGWGDTDKIAMYSVGSRYYDFNNIPRVAGVPLVKQDAPTFTSDLNVYVPDEGRIRLLGGTDTRSGMCLFEDVVGTNLGYVGYANTSEIRAWSYGGQYFNFNVMPRVNGVPMGLASYESPATAWVANSRNTFAHGLGVIPKIIDARLKMKASIHGFSTGREVQLSTDTAGAVVWADATNVYVHTANVGGVNSVRGNGLAAYITPAQANLIIRAYA